MSKLASLLAGALALSLGPGLCAQSASSVSAPRTVPSPESFLGQKIGADRFLANYTQLRAYWAELARHSDRLQVREIGETSYGQPMVMAIVTAPENFARLEEHRQTSRALALAKGLDDRAARQLATAGKAVVWIDAGMHATESVAAQNIIELVYRLVAGEDAESRRIRAEVITLVCPANPDGMEMIANAYMATGHVGRLPVLYQRYIGHDNNRDFYMSSQPETAAINRVLYRQWFPQIVYNHHQSAPAGTILFTPPFRDPFNYNFDPMVVRGIELVASHINSRFAWEEKPGIISRSGARYSTWWNGGLRTTTYFHNMIGILTEARGTPDPQRLAPSVRRRLPSGDHPQPIGPTMWHARQTIEYLQTANFALLTLAARYREDFLYNIYQMGRNSIRRGSQDHWTVTPRLIAEAERRGEAARAAAARARSAGEDPDTDAGTDRKTSPGEDQVEAGAEGEAEPAGEGTRASVAAVREATFRDPALRDARGYVMPLAQTDPTALRRFIGMLLKTGIDVGRLESATTIGGRPYAAGSYVVRCDQAFRPHIRDMFEPQWHPDDVDAGGEPIRPYDSAGWTPALQMGIEFDRVFDGFAAPIEHLDAEAAEPALVGEVVELPSATTSGSGNGGYLLVPGDSANFACVNELLRAGERVHCLRKAARAGERELPRGTVLVRRGAATADRVRDLAARHGARFLALAEGIDVEALSLRPVRVGLFDVYGGNMATGWTQWVLDRHGFDVKLVFGGRVIAGELRDDFDVLIFHTGLPDPGGKGRVQRALRRGRPTQLSDTDLERMVAALPPFEDWSRARERRVALNRQNAVPPLRAFMDAGGIVIALGDQSVLAARLFDVPVEEGVFVPGKEPGDPPRRAVEAQFFIPGSLLRIDPLPGHDVTAGLPSSLSAMFRRSAVFRLAGTAADDAAGEMVRILAQYPATGEVLVSGWAVGAELLRGGAAALEARIGSGRLYLFGADFVYRGQPQGTIKMLLQAILLGGSAVADPRAPGDGR